MATDELKIAVSEVYTRGYEAGWVAAELDRSAMQAELDRRDKEIERLRAELKQAKAECADYEHRLGWTKYYS